MPLQDHFPLIDDRSYDTIVAEARSRIPRYTAEWTNLNDTDPGMAMVQLFAWMTEMQLFRLAQVPQLHYLKFLELIGIELEPAKPATALVNFPMQASFSKTFTIVPAKTQVSTEQADDQGRILFETDKAITVIRSQLSHLLSDDNFNFRDITNDNLDTLTEFQPFGPAAAQGDSFMLGFDAALPETTVHLYVWTPQPANNNGAVMSQCFQNTDPVTSTRLAWEYWDGREWSRTSLLKDDTAAFSRSGEIQIKAPAEGRMASEIFGELAQARFWLRVRITHSGYEQAPAIVAIRTNVAALTQAQTIEYESVGGSNGEIDQIHRLRYSPVIAGSLVLEVDEGAGYPLSSWRRSSRIST
ncbi:MAG: hypothetical protein AAFZ92_06385, partial [Pseudomonadota bacterium]